MYKGKLIGVVVPAYNEQRLIGRVIGTMPDFVDKIYVVDDQSKDATCDKVRLWLADARYHGRLQLIEHEQNQGVGAAIVTGYEQAVADGMEVIAVMAGDAQMNPDELPRVLEPVCEGRVDYVKGNRYQSGQAWERMPRYRYFGNACLSTMTRIASGYWHVGDSQTGYTALSREAILAMPMRELYSRYGYPNHLLIMLAVYGFRVVDVPIEPIYDIGEVSGIRLKKVIPRMSWLIGRKFAWRLNERRRRQGWDLPLALYAFSAVALLASLPLAAAVLWQWLLTGKLAGAAPAALGITSTAGILAALQAMLCEYRLNHARHADCFDAPAATGEQPPDEHVAPLWADASLNRADNVAA